MRAEADLLLAAVTWAERHPAESIEDAATWADRGGDCPLPLAGEGAPLVAEFCIAEFAAVIARPTIAGRIKIAHALELKYRLPRHWARVQTRNRGAVACLPDRGRHPRPLPGSRRLRRRPGGTRRAQGRHHPARPTRRPRHRHLHARPRHRERSEGRRSTARHVLPPPGRLHGHHLPPRRARPRRCPRPRDRHHRRSRSAPPRRIHRVPRRPPRHRRRPHRPRPPRPRPRRTRRRPSADGASESRPSAPSPGRSCSTCTSPKPPSPAPPARVGSSWRR